VLDGENLTREDLRGGEAQLEALDFKEENGGGRVELKLLGEAGWKVDRPDAQSAVLTLEGVKMPRKLERSLDTSELQGLVKMVSAFPLPGEKSRVRVVVAATSALGESVVVKPGGLEWHFKRVEQSIEATTADSRSAGLAVEATQVALEGAPQRPRYVGKKVSFEFKDIDIHNLLRIIAEISKKNIVVADDVGGKVTIRLRNVPWDQALDLVLRSKSLGQEDLGNILRVAPLSKLEDEANSRLKRRESELETRELSVQLVPVNYATAGEMSARVKEVLTKRGNVAVDTRTNTLIVRDLPENMQRVRSLVASLDLQTPQVLIESRIVEANVRFQREVGVQWGGQAVMANSNGNPTGLQFPNSIAATGGIVGGAVAGVQAAPNYAVSLPVGAGDGSGGALGLVFGTAGSAATLNLRLSALESQGSIKTLSAPRVTTLDNRQARISQGLSIPFSQTSAAGANTVFVDAILSLAVTPHVTQDGSILMDVNASNNAPDVANSGSNGQPGISRKEAQTNVLVKDGDTTVIGGIYVRRGSSVQAGLPLLSKIPVLGFFFRNYRELETKDELLIFISPRILNRQTVAQN
jgi:type IV pilus assembly protein PilQ